MIEPTFKEFKECLPYLINVHAHNIRYTTDISERKRIEGITGLRLPAFMGSQKRLNKLNSLSILLKYDNKRSIITPDEFIVAFMMGYYKQLQKVLISGEARVKPENVRFISIFNDMDKRRCLSMLFTTQNEKKTFYYGCQCIKSHVYINDMLFRSRSRILVFYNYNYLPDEILAKILGYNEPYTEKEILIYLNTVRKRKKDNSYIYNALWM